MKKILVSSFNSKYFKAGITLIASLHRNALETIDEMVVYDLGMNPFEVAFLNRCEKVRVVSYPPRPDGFFDGFLEPGSFAWKPFAIKHGGDEGDLVLYLDAGIVTLKDIATVYELIARDEIFLVQDKQPNAKWTTPRAFELMNASAREKEGQQICAGIFGYKVGGKYQSMIDDAYRYAQNKEIICGDRKCHRHDQSIYSVLAIRYHCPTQPLEIYGEWRGILRENQVLYVHRRKYKNRSGLRIIPLHRWLSHSIIKKRNQIINN